MSARKHPTSPLLFLLLLLLQSFHQFLSDVEVRWVSRCAPPPPPTTNSSHLSLAFFAFAFSCSSPRGIWRASQQLRGKREPCRYTDFSFTFISMNMFEFIQMLNTESFFFFFFPPVVVPQSSAHETALYWIIHHSNHFCLAYLDDNFQTQERNAVGELRKKNVYVSVRGKSVSCLLWIHLKMKSSFCRIMQRLRAGECMFFWQFSMLFLCPCDSFYKWSNLLLMQF